MCCTRGPVLEVLQSMDPKLGWSKHRDELRHCFSPNKTSVHAAALLIQFRKQEKNENLRSYIHQYTKLHLQATNLLPKNDFDLLRKVQFLRRLHSKTIANKIVRSNAFKNCTTYSMADCFAKALELKVKLTTVKCIGLYISLAVFIKEGRGQDLNLIALGTPLSLRYHGLALPSMRETFFSGNQLMANTQIPPSQHS